VEQGQYTRCFHGFFEDFNAFYAVALEVEHVVGLAAKQKSFVFGVTNKFLVVEGNKAVIILLLFSRISCLLTHRTIELTAVNVVERALAVGRRSDIVNDFPIFKGSVELLLTKLGKVLCTLHEVAVRNVSVFSLFFVRRIVPGSALSIEANTCAEHKQQRENPAGEANESIHVDLF
jgi:hypothetical protein